MEISLARPWQTSIIHAHSSMPAARKTVIYFVGYAAFTDVAISAKSINPSSVPGWRRPRMFAMAAASVSAVGWTRKSTHPNTWMTAIGKRLYPAVKESIRPLRASSE